MKLPFVTLNPKIFILLILVLVGVPVTVFLVSQNQNIRQEAYNLEKCYPDKESGWPECRYGQETYNLDQCRAHAEEWKNMTGPHGQDDTAWYIWGRYEGEKRLSCGTACGIAPSFCIVDNTPTPSPVPSNTPEPPTATPTSPPNSPTPTDIPPTATDVPPTPTDTISSCPVPRVPDTGLNVKVECPFCE